MESQRRRRVSSNTNELLFTPPSITLLTLSLFCAALAVDALFALPAEIIQHHLLFLGGVEVAAIKVRALPNALEIMYHRCSVDIRGVEVLV